MKKIFLAALALQALSLSTTAQVIYSNSFGNLTLQTYTTTPGGSTQYTTTIPTGLTLINDGHYNNTGPEVAPNRPFNVAALKTSGWATVYNAAENDTFLVSTSWLDTLGFTANRWVLLPPVFIPIGSAATVLTWLAKSPDPNAPEGYEVYGTPNTSLTLPTGFAIGDRLFNVVDGNTAGQGEKSTWTRHSINLSNFVGQTMRFAFKDNSKDMYQLWIDDIEIKTLANNLDASVQEVIVDKYVITGSSNSVKASVTNTGASDISSVELKYVVNNGSVNTEQFTLNPPLAYGQSTTLAFALPYTVATASLYPIKSWISSVNFGFDQNPLNDMAEFNVTVQASRPSKHVLLEQFVSANNGESPNVQDKAIALETSSVIVVNIHTGDSLQVAGSSALIADYKPTVGSALLDRRYFRDTDKNTIQFPEYGTRLNTEYYELSPATISITAAAYNGTTNVLTFILQSDFVGEVKGDYRLNAYLIENNVCGPYSDTTINGYNQLNNYYNIGWSPFYHSGYFSPLVNTYVMNAINFKHRNTLVHSFDGAYGLPGLIPSTGGTQGQPYEKTYTLTLPPAPAGVQKFVADNIYIVGFLTEYDSDKNKRTVLNTVRQKLTAKTESVGIVGVPEIASDLVISVFPNPSNSGLFYLNTKENENYELRVYDLFGKCLKTESVRKAGTLDLSGFSDGIYLLSMKSGKTVLTKKIVIQKN